jgi:hypothetical protein
MRMVVEVPGTEYLADFFFAFTVKDVRERLSSLIHTITYPALDELQDKLRPKVFFSNEMMMNIR